MALFRRILVPTDFSDCSQQALALAIEMARSSDADLTIVHTCEIPAYAYSELSIAPGDLLSPVAEIAQAKLDELVREVRERCPGVRGVLKLGIPWEQIVATAAEVAADLVVIATHGRSGVAHALVGSVTEKVVRHSPVPVLTVRARPKQRENA